MSEPVDVLIVGAGPTGLTLANLLGVAGVRTLVVERNRTTSDLPKAVSLDDEALRTMQRADVDAAVRRIVLPGTGTKYFGVNGKPVAYARGPARSRHGHPMKNPFQQPELEATLVTSLRDRPEVELRFDTRLVALDQSPSHAIATLSHDNGAETVTARYVVGCDGGSSTVRDQLGITLSGRSFSEPWIVIDTVNDPHTQRYGMHHGDPRRPHLVIPGRDGFCRYEFLLHPGEAADADDLSFELVRELLAPYRTVQPDDVLRKTVYTFHALTAPTWRIGRVFLAGDAAHMMPPFAGQGLNAGIRDADNLSWKLTAVLSGVMNDGLLDSYQAERLAHATQIVAFSARLGRIVMTTSRVKALTRDVLLRSAAHLPAARRYLTEMRFRPAPVHREGFVWRRGPARAVVGRPIRQAQVLQPDGRLGRLDDHLGTGFAVLAVEGGGRLQPGLSDPVWDRLGAQRLEMLLDDQSARASGPWSCVADEDGMLAQDLAAARGCFVLVRPDRYIAAAVPPGMLPDFRAWLTHFPPATAAITSRADK